MPRKWTMCVAGLALCLAACEAVKREASQLQERLKVERDAGAVEAEDAFDTPPPPTGAAGLAPGRYRLMAAGATVTRRNASGQAWDLVGGPGADPELTVLVDGKRVAGCGPITDTTRVLCPLDVPLTVSAATEIAIAVVDDDLTGDQPIGDAAIRELTRSGRVGVRLLLAPRGQVTSAVIELVAVPPPPSAWAQHRGLLIGVAIGVGVGILLLLGFRSSLLGRAMVMRAALSTAEWTCAFCDHTNGGGAASCRECGARRKKARPRDGDRATRPDADRAFTLAMAGAVIAGIAWVLITLRDVPIDPVIPTAIAAAGLPLAIAGWIHERAWRARTAEALGASAAAVVLGPLLGQFVIAGVLLTAAIGLVMLVFWFSD